MDLVYAFSRHHYADQHSYVDVESNSHDDFNYPRGTLCTMVSFLDIFIWLHAFLFLSIAVVSQVERGFRVRQLEEEAFKRL